MARTSHLAQFIFTAGELEDLRGDQYEVLVDSLAMVIAMSPPPPDRRLPAFRSQMTLIPNTWHEGLPPLWDRDDGIARQVLHQALERVEPIARHPSGPTGFAELVATTLTSMRQRRCAYRMMAFVAHARDDAGPRATALLQHVAHALSLPAWTARCLDAEARREVARALVV